MQENAPPTQQNHCAHLIITVDPPFYKDCFVYFEVVLLFIAGVGNTPCTVFCFLGRKVRRGRETALRTGLSEAA